VQTGTKSGIDWNTRLGTIVEHLLSNRPGDWRVIIIGSQERADWEMKIFGPNAFERSYTIEEAAG
jgi:hypothetical protein